MTRSLGIPGLAGIPHRKLLNQAFLEEANHCFLEQGQAPKPDGFDHRPAVLPYMMNN